MKAKFFAAFLTLATTIHGAEQKDDFPSFHPLNKQQAAATARKQAEADFAAGHYRMLVYGLRRQTSPFDQRLAKEGVEVKAIAGCIVSDGILEGRRAAVVRA